MRAKVIIYFTKDAPKYYDNVSSFMYAVQEDDMVFNINMGRETRVIRCTVNDVKSWSCFLSKEDE